MATTLTATPQPATASVLLEIEDTTAPVTVLDENAADLYARTWSYAPGIKSLAGGLLWFTNTSDEPSPTGQTALTGLTVGHTYRATVHAQRGTQATSFTCGGVSGVVPEGSGVWAHTVTFTAASTTAMLILAAGSATWGLDPLKIQRLVLEDVPTDYSFALLRSDANGIRPVRLYEGQGLTAGSLIVTDYEAALTGPITYTVTTTETATATTALNLADPWLMVPVLPQYSAAFQRATGFTEDNDARSTVHEIIGSEYVAVTLRPLGRRTGTLEVWCADYTAMRAVRAVYRRGEVVLLRQADHPGMDLYHVATGRLSAGLYDPALNRWRLTVEYTEVPSPLAPLSGALGWDLAASLERNPTLAASAAEFPTLADLLIGPTS